MEFRVHDNELFQCEGDMRQGQNPKRSRGRSSGRRSNVPARHQTFDSNGPSVRIRGSAFQVHEKYLTMARDAAAAGDRVAAENYQQHAEHYFRIINAESDGDNNSNVQRAGRLQQGDQYEGDGETGEEEVATVEVTTPSPGNVAAPEYGEGSEQPAVEFPNGENAAGNGSAEAAAPAPKKPRAPRAPRVPRPPRSRAPRASGNSGGDDIKPPQSED